MEVYPVKTSSVLPLGKQGENLVRQIQFDLSRWISTFGPGTVQLLHQRSGDEAPYPVAVEKDGTQAIWTVTNADTAAAGTGRAELQYYVGDALAKSETWMTKVLAALGPAGETPPEAQQGWVDQVLAQVARITGMTAQAVELPAGSAPTADYADGVLTIGIPLGGDVSEAQIAQAVAEYLSKNPIAETDPTVPDWAKEEKKPSYTAAEVGADPSGTAASQVSAHNTETTAHSDIRLLIQGLTERLNALADSDDTTLDQLSEIVAYIKSNRELIAAVTTDKVGVTDIVNDLVTNVANKPLSAAQGVALKALVDALSGEITTLKNQSDNSGTVDSIELSGWVYGYVTADGELMAGGNGYTSDYVEVSSGRTYTIVYPSSITAVRFAIYDSDKNFLNRIIDGTSVYTADADGYIRVTVENADGYAEVYLTVMEASASVDSDTSSGGADYSFLSGLKYYALGDSIVAMQGTAAEPLTFGDSGYSGDLQGRDITDITVDGYVSAIENRYGLAATNYGAAGHTLVQDYASLAAKDYSDVALVTIAYGANDARTGVPLGTVNSTDVTTFAGALNQLLRKIYTDNPECRVIVLTPIQRLYVSDFGIGTVNSNGNYLIDFVDMCKKVAAKRSTKCIDMYRDCGINQTNLYFYTVEGVHTVNQGFARMKGAIIPVLDDMFALEYEPFGTMTNTGDTEPDEPDTGGDSGEDTPPEEETGPTVVDLSGLFVLAGTYYDAYASFKSNTTLASIDHPGVALEGGHTYTLITYLPCSADDTWAYGGALADNPSMDPTGGTTLSFGKAVGTFEVVTINGSYYGKCSYTFTIDAGITKYLYTARAANLDDSYVSLTYI